MSASGSSISPRRQTPRPWPRSSSRDRHHRSSRALTTWPARRCTRGLQLRAGQHGAHPQGGGGARPRSQPLVQQRGDGHGREDRDRDHDVRPQHLQVLRVVQADGRSARGPAEGQGGDQEVARTTGSRLHNLRAWPAPSAGRASRPSSSTAPPRSATAPPARPSGSDRRTPCTAPSGLSGSPRRRGRTATSLRAIPSTVDGWPVTPIDDAAPKALIR
jgi:hypothetical protein